MLKFQNDLVEDAKANKICKKFINNRLLELLRLIKIGYIDFDYELDIPYEECLESYFPYDYDKEKRKDKLEGLIAILEDKNEHVPELIMEYLLAKVIKREVEREQLDSSLKVHLQWEDREYVLKKIKIECKKYLEEEDNLEELIKWKIESIEDIEQYQETCFWDCDYELLDIMSLDKLKNSKLNQDLGVIVEDDDTFTLKIDGDSKE